MRTLVASILVVSLAASIATGCKRKTDDDQAASADTSSPPPASPSHAAAAPKPHGTAHPAAAPGHPPPPPPGGGPALGEKVEIPQAMVVFNAPGGWKKDMHANGWALYKAPDNHARLGYVAFSQPGEATSRLGQLAETFDLSNLTWGSPTDGYVGRDRFPDHEGDTRSCTMKNGDPCDMKYMTINPGGSVQVMVVYLVNTAHGEALRSHAVASVNSLRRM
jgi:hypothetical protein